MSSINRVTQLYEQLEKELYSSLLSTLLSNDIVINDGKIVFNTNNTKFFDKEIRSLTTDVKPSVSKIKTELEAAIKEALDKEVIQFTKVDVRATEISKPIINRILKHSNLSVSEGIKLDPLFTKIKGRIVALVSKQGGISLQELRDSLQKLIVNKHLVNGYFERWTYDIYNQYRRAAANEIRKKLGLRFAVYEGGEIETTRAHCDEYAGLVLSEKEIEAWKDLPMWNGRPAEGYDPFIDCGGYNCRHRWRWISDGLAAVLLEDQGKGPKDLNIEAPTITVNLGSEQRFNDYVNDSEVPELVKNAIGKLPIPSEIKSKGARKGSYYSKSTNSLISETKGGQRVFFHEYGHHIDLHKMRNNTISENANGVNSRSINMKESYSKDLENIKDKYKGDTLGLIRDYLKPKNSQDYIGFSDIIDAMSNGAFFDKYKMAGHGKRYYNRDKNNKYYEAYANVFEAIARNNKSYSNDMKEHFPNMFKFVMDDLNKIANDLP
jgi:hypothetical protein